MSKKIRHWNNCNQSSGSCLKYIINTEVVVQPEAFDFIEKETLVFSYEVFKIS